MIADIEGFIGRRAAELASQRGPRGGRKGNCGSRGSRWLQTELTRATDVNAELRRRITGLERQCAAWREVTGVKHPHELASAKPARPENRKSAHIGTTVGR